MNKVVIGRRGAMTTSYAACSCGRRFGIDGTARDELVALIESQAAERADTGTAHRASTSDVRAELWPLDSQTAHAKKGIVPVGTPVLHRPATRKVDADAAGVLSTHMLTAMANAEGIGLAANQVGVGARVIVHRLGDVAPQVLLDPVLVEASAETWLYREACLSLHLEGSAAELSRPKKVVVHARLLTGDQVALAADEILARVLQHELDHLAGIEYVQRLDGTDQLRVYELMARSGIDESWLPPCADG